MPLRVRAIEVVSRVFAQRHGLVLPAAGDKLTFGKERGGGGYGTVHPVERVGGRRPAPRLLLKLYSPEALRGGDEEKLLDHARILFERLAQSPDPRWHEALLALPYAIFKTEGAGTTQLASLMIDLADKGYQSFGVEPDDAVRLRARPVDKRIDAAVRFAERYQLLENLRYVHGDLNPENVMVNPGTNDVQVIDLDTGAVVETGAERPLTVGKPDECLPPELKRGISVDTDRYTAGAERWSLGSMIGFLLFGFHPGFFLARIGPKEIEAYATSPFRWPMIDRTSDLFTTQQVSMDAYERLIDELTSWPESVSDLFGRFFAAGLDGSARPDARDWIRGLSNLRKPPEIELFTWAVAGEPSRDASFLLEGEELELSWIASNATHVEVESVGTRPAAGSERIVCDKSRSYTIRAVNPFGSVIRSTSVVRVVALPRLDVLPLPAFPGLNLKVNLTAVPVPQPDAVVLRRLAPVSLHMKRGPEVRIGGPPDRDGVPPPRFPTSVLPGDGLEGSALPRFPALPWSRRWPSLAEVRAVIEGRVRKTRAVGDEGATWEGS